MKDFYIKIKEEKLEELVVRDKPALRATHSLKTVLGLYLIFTPEKLAVLQPSCILQGSWSILKLCISISQQLI